MKWYARLRNGVAPKWALRQRRTQAAINSLAEKGRTRRPIPYWRVLGRECERKGRAR